ncbi:MAG TPA: hypothetical protein VFP98_06025 [Candidatus Polarisedimenticolia bacterium]|nr:hypothetical protein [Candidatus Polarisedimenticolia bacterium]
MGIEQKKLGAEDLEKRSAPFTLYEEPIGDEPVGDVGGGGTLPSDPAPADQPGNSDGNRSKLYKENQ